MIFQHTHELVMSGAKTQTRRIATPDTHAHFVYGTDTISAVVQYKDGWPTYRTKWEVGKTYAVSTGRGKSAVARIKITGIRKEDVRQISFDDVAAEGFLWVAEFFDTWTRMHDKPMAPFYHYDIEDLANRPAERYQAWVLEFALVER